MSGIFGGTRIFFTFDFSGAAELEDINVKITIKPETKSALSVNIVTDYGAVGDGITNNATAFKSFQTWAQAQTLPITLIIPAGDYVQGAHWMQGIDKLTVIGGRPTTLADNRRVGTSSWQRQSAQHSLRLEAVSAGDTVLTVKNTDPARLPAALGNPASNPDRDLATLMALVVPGDWVLLSAWDTMGFGYPTNPQMFEYAQVASVGASAITLTAPTKYAYSDAFPVYWNGATLQQATNISGLSGTFVAGETVTASGGATGLVVHSYPSSFNGATNGVRFTLDSLVGKTVATGETLTGQTSGATATVVQTGPNGLGGFRNFEADQAGPATLHVLDRDWDTEITLRDLTWATLSNAQVGMAGRSLTFENVDFTPMTAPSNSLWPSGAKDLSFIDCDMNTPEHDKLIETLTIRGGSAATHIVQSASIDRMVLQDHTCNNVNGTARSTELRNVTAANAVRIGPLAYGRTDSVLIENSSAATLGWSSRAVLLADVTFNAGVFSKSDPNPQGVASFGQEWAVPGTKIALANSAGQVLDIATITAFSESGGTASVTTDLSALPAGADRIYPHPCWDVTASGNTGALAVLNGSTNQPLFSHANLTGAGSTTLWGGLTELRINVTSAHAGDLVISGPAHDGAWSATINLNNVGERVITTAGATGAQAGDTLPAAGWFQGAFTVTAGGGAFTITATTDQTAAVPVPAVISSQTLGYYPMDEASGNFTNALYPTAYLKRGSTVTQQVEASGLVLARTGATSTDEIVANSADGLVLSGGEPWCMHGFFRWRADTTKAPLRAGGNLGPWEGEASFGMVWNSGHAYRLGLLNDAGTTIYTFLPGFKFDGTLQYVAFGWDGANAFIKRSLDGSTWTTATTATSAQMEIPPHILTLSHTGASVDIGQLCVTRNIPTENDLTWFANGMTGRATSEVTARLGTWPELTELTPTTQTNGGTTWSGTTLLTNTGFVTVNNDTAADGLAGVYWLKPYYLRGMDASLADTHGDYVWLTSSDHQTAGISIGFSNSPSIPPTSWSRIWAAGVSGEPGATNADISGHHASSETPWLVYNPDDVNGRPFWLYYHDPGRSIAQGDGSTGYNAPQETRLITSSTLLRGSWQYERTVLPVRNYGPNQVLNHRGYAVVQRHGTGNWEAWHLGSDRWDHTYARSTSTDGLTWDIDWFVAPPAEKPYYQRWHLQQHCPPGWRLGALQDIFTFNGQRYALGHMGVASRDGANGGANSWPSFRDPDQRHIYIAPLGADGLLSGPPTIVYEANGTYYDPPTTQAEHEAHEGYIQGSKCYLEGSTLHIYVKHRVKTPSYIVHAMVDLSPLAA